MFTWMLFCFWNECRDYIKNKMKDVKIFTIQYTRWNDSHQWRNEYCVPMVLLTRKKVTAKNNNSMRCTCHTRTICLLMFCMYSSTSEKNEGVNVAEHGYRLIHCIRIYDCRYIVGYFFYSVMGLSSPQTVIKYKWYMYTFLDFDKNITRIIVKNCMCTFHGTKYHSLWRAPETLDI